jgi:microcystin-dependent protein
MYDAFIGSIVLFAGNFVPQHWAFCHGQILNISQNTALFSILGTTYGGNGTTTFALPDLRGRVPVQQGQGPGLDNIQLGQMSGSKSITPTAVAVKKEDGGVAVATAQAQSNIPPSLGLNYIICLQGIYPARD